MKKLALLLLAVAAGLGAATKDFEYGVHLFRDGDYYRAITELERFRYFEPKAKESEAALWLVAAAYLKGEKWEQAAKNYDDFALAYPQSRRLGGALFFKAESLYESRKLAAAREAFAAVHDPQFGATPQLRLASMDLIEGHWDQAAKQFDGAKKIEPARLSDLQRWESLSLQGQAMKPFSPALAFLSSAIIPGSGQMEAGYLSDGLSSLLAVGGFAAWAAYFFSNQQATQGAIFGVAGGIFYLANLHGAVIAAQRANRNRPRALIKQILDEVGGRAAPEPDLNDWVEPK